MSITVSQAAAIVSLLSGREISRNQIGSAIGVSRQTAHRNKDRELEEIEIAKIEKKRSAHRQNFTKFRKISSKHPETA